ncbi:TPA: phage tail protein [Klebsiella pneumoniae]|nr:phage tail protein [Klebsiella pneumoniae]MCE0045942.1 phage tail protein [Klebsiella pneumoniae]HBX2761845.1 phage tail protein [Klebsiella pneumoniae]HCC2507473.1 phage tail protein [Klebsiella pneumoniae]
MAKRFYTRLTAAGEQRLAEAAVSGAPVNITQMAVGDGNGSVPEPANREDLLNEVYRAPLNRLVIADQAANVIRAEMLILPQTGGFWMREAALYDDDGVCLAVANLPESYKPKLAEGSGRLHAVNVWIAISSTENVQLIAEPSVIMATVDEIERAKNEVKDYVDQLLGDTITAAKRDFWEEDNPPGTVRFFAQNVDPNEKWPWSKWTYTGENKTIRVGKADGSDVGQSGGRDTVTLQQANLPAVQIDVSGETSEQEEQKLTTTRGGVHNHGGVAGKDDPWEIGGDVRQLFNPKELGVTDDAGEHDHEVTVPPHKHSISGKTANLGEGESFSVVESHTLLMCWARVA